MKRFAALLVFSLLATQAVPQAEAKGCLKGAVVGAIAGHYAHHHAILGAMAGCAVGHHLAAVKARHDAERNSHPRPAAHH
jgi:hypothetical protein